MQVYRQLFSYIPERKWHAYLAIALTAVSVFIQFWAYHQMWIVLKLTFTGQADQRVIQTGLAIIGLIILQGFIYLAGVWMSHLAAFRLETRLREKGIQRLLRASASFFDTHSSGEVRKIIDNNVEQTHMAVAHLIPDQTAALLTLILMLVLVFALDLYLFAFFVVVAIASILTVKGMMGDLEFMEVYQRKLDEMNGAAVEFVRGMPVVKIFAAPIVGLKQLYQSIVEYRDLVYQNCLSCRVPFVTFQWLLNIFIVTPVFIGLWQVQAGADARLWAAKLLFFTLFMGLYFSTMMRVMYVMMNVYQAHAAVTKLEELFVEMDKKKPHYGQLRAIEDTSIAFQQVTFAYEGGTPILQNFSLNLPGGQTYALVGPSGSGKSTIAKLLSGLYPLDKGEIKLGGQDLFAYSQEALRQGIGMVYQQAQVFKDLSIFENVALAKKDANKEEVLEALKQAQCEEFLSKFKDGYDTLIGTAGIELSGGEVQRISIARLFLKDPQLIILDEASAAADPENEYDLQVALSNLMEGRTAVMIAHRLSSIRGVDEILFVEGGEVKERGSHEELMAKNGRYKAFVSLYELANEWRV